MQLCNSIVSRGHHAVHESPFTLDVYRSTIEVEFRAERKKKPGHFKRVPKSWHVSLKSSPLGLPTNNNVVSNWWWRDTDTSDWWCESSWYLTSLVNGSGTHDPRGHHTIHRCRWMFIDQRPKLSFGPKGKRNPVSSNASRNHDTCH
jgi:hypothetical protein